MMPLLAVTAMLVSCSVAMAAPADEAPSEGPTPAAEATVRCTISAAAVAEAAQQVGRPTCGRRQPKIPGGCLQGWASKQHLTSSFSPAGRRRRSC